jgi:hypothetical protein
VSDGLEMLRADEVIECGNGSRSAVGLGCVKTPERADHME